MELNNLIPNNVGNRLLVTRKSYGLTQEEFGRVMGVKAGTVREYEEGQRVPDPAFLRNVMLQYIYWLVRGDFEK